MFCPKCLQEVPPSSTACPLCGHNFAPGELLSAPPGARVPAPPPPLPVAKRSFLDRAPGWLLTLFTAGCAILVFAIGYYRTKVTSHSSQAEASGYLFGTVLTSTLIAWLIVWLSTRKRNPSLPGNQKGAIGASIALLVSLISLAGEMKPKLGPPTESETRERIARLAKEGTGQAPKGADEGKYDEIIRPFFADIKKFNDDYQAESKALDSSALKALYGAQSFDGDQNISQVLEQLRAMKAVEDKYSSLDPLLQKTKQRLFASSASKEEKTAFWNSFENSFKKSVEPRNAVNTSEQVWLADSIGLYEFMQTNEKSFHVKNNKVIFATTNLLNEYNEKLDKVDGERKAFLTAKQKFEQTQKEGLAKMGLKPSDFNSADK